MRLKPLARPPTLFDAREAGSSQDPLPLQTRRYLHGTPYLLPKDHVEGDRLNFQHHALFQVLGNHYVAPLDPAVRTILDVGCGTGLWAVEMAHLFPASLVVGLDLDPACFRTVPPVPAHCLLRVGDVLKGLPFPEQFFDYTHQRLLVYAIPAMQWPEVVRELVRVTRVGGWIECIEADPTLQNQGPATQEVFAQIEAIQLARSITVESIQHLGDLFRHVGLQQVEVQTMLLPLGTWGGRVGVLLKQNALGVVRAMKDLCCQPGGLDPQTFDALVGQMDAEWEAYHTSCRCYAIYGKRVST